MSVKNRKRRSVRVGEDGVEDRDHLKAVGRIFGVLPEELQKNLSEIVIDGGMIRPKSNGCLQKIALSSVAYSQHFGGHRRNRRQKPRMMLKQLP